MRAMSSCSRRSRRLNIVRPARTTLRPSVSRTSATTCSPMVTAVESHSAFTSGMSSCSSEALSASARASRQSNASGWVACSATASSVIEKRRPSHNDSGASAWLMMLAYFPVPCGTTRVKRRRSRSIPSPWRAIARCATRMPASSSGTSTTSSGARSRQEVRECVGCPLEADRLGSEAAPPQSGHGRLVLAISSQPRHVVRPPVYHAGIGEQPRLHHRVAPERRSPAVRDVVGDPEARVGDDTRDRRAPDSHPPARRSRNGGPRRRVHAPA